MTSKKIISVVGATGAQGGSVVDYLLQSGEFHVRGITRDVKSEAAQALAKKGVEVVAGNVLEPETIKKAIAGSYGFYALTDFWNKDQMGKEEQIGKSLVDVAKEAKITHFMWASLADCATESKGKYQVAHFTDKAKVEQYARKAGFPYHTYVAAPFYYQNWGNFFFVKPFKQEDGSLSFSLPVPETTYFSMGDISEFGSNVLAAFRNPKGWGNGDYIAVIGEHAPLGEIFKVLGAHLGKKVTLQQVSKEAYFKAFPFKADELYEMFEWFRDYGYYGRLVDLTSGHKAKGSALKGFAEWLRETKFEFTSFN